MTREETINRLQEIVDSNKNALLVRVHIGVIIHALRYLKENDKEAIYRLADNEILPK